ncbi:MAG: PhnD/SsuA/transferrin family substrate-binding protein [Desulfobulbaceae bacterium]|nr:PhnD/SsuA/transferrin family substrate-binding protein [Desulfobulbaceae bacterium]MCK5545414.1 PhnD/SsuA/transferrin family substrate-binding protein [Desulfobulbaceae bacterium]
MNNRGGKIKKRIVAVFILLLAGIYPLFSASALSHASPTLQEFYYFNPDSTQINLGNLKIEMVRFLQQRDYPVSFQPFAHLRDFHQQVREKKPAFLFLPHWYLNQPDTPPNIKPLLIPLRNGQKTYAKVLMTNNSSGTTINSLSQKTLAMTTLGPQSEEILDKILFHKLAIDASELRYIHVPKDFDALIALAIGQVDLALVSHENIAELRRINPILLAAVKPLMESNPIELPVLCYTEGSVSPAELDKFKKIFLQGINEPKKLKIMKMLQIDDWKTTVY